MYGIMASSFSGVNDRLGLAETTATSLGNDIGALNTSISAVALDAGTNTLDIATISAWSATAAPIVSDLESWSATAAPIVSDLESWSASVGDVSTVSLMSATSIFDARLVYIETRLSHLFDAIAVYDPEQPANSITFATGGAGPSLTALGLNTWLGTYSLAEEE
jgi:hypothetical protein